MTSRYVRARRPRGAAYSTDDLQAKESHELPELEPDPAEQIDADYLDFDPVCLLAYCANSPALRLSCCQACQAANSPLTPFGKATEQGLIPPDIKSKLITVIEYIRRETYQAKSNHAGNKFGKYPAALRA